MIITHNNNNENNNNHTDIDNGTDNTIIWK